jgi:hypothetical protein
LKLVIGATLLLSWPGKLHDHEDRLRISMVASTVAGTATFSHSMASAPLTIPTPPAPTLRRSATQVMSREKFDDTNGVRHAIDYPQSAFTAAFRDERL